MQEENVTPNNRWSGIYLMIAIVVLLILAKVLLT